MNLEDHWRAYVSKYHKTSYKRARDVVETVEEVEESDEEDMLLDLPDNDFPPLPNPDTDSISND